MPKSKTTSRSRRRRNGKPAADATVLSRELEVHREELAAQNEELRRANAEVTAAKERYAELYDVAPTGYFTLDAMGRIVEANLTGAELFGVPRAALFGRTFDDLVAPAERDAFRSLRRRVLERGLREGLESVVTTRSHPMPVHLEAAVLAPEPSAPRRILLCVTDETARRRADDARRSFEARLAEVHRLESLGRLAGGVAHHFNNILAIVLLQADMALAAIGESPVRAELDAIRAAAQRAADLSKLMIAYAGGGTLEAQTIDLSSLVTSMETLLRSSVAKGIVLDLALTPRLPSLWGDRMQLQQVLLNLVVNASEAIGPRGGRVRVHTFTATEANGAPRVCLEVADDGPGMDEPTRRRAFDPFFSTKRAGRGLGLAVVHGNVHGNGGTVAITSRAPNGTSFVASFPASADAASAPNGQNHHAQIAWQGEGRVLVVDDEVPLRRATAEALALFGFSTQEAADGREAIDLVRNAPGSFDVVLLDLTMPGIDGRDALRELKTLEPRLPVVIMSGQSGMGGDGALAAADALLPKPFELSALESVVRRLIDRRAAAS